MPHLVGRGHDVEVVDLLWFGEHLEAPVPVWNIDAREITVSGMERFNCVIFLAGMSNDPMADHDPMGNYEENAALPAYLARIAAQAGVQRFIHGGSCSVYGLSDMTLFETDEPRTQTPYGVSKYMAEIGCMQQAGPMSVINFRQGTVAGYSPRMRFDLVINAMVKDALTKQTLTVNDPDAWRPILAIDDAIRAYAAAVAAPLDISGTYNIASENMSVMDIALTIKSLVAAPIEIEVGNVRDCRSYRVNCALARNEMRWQPQWNIKQIAVDLIDKCYLLESFEKDEFYNIRTFKKMRSAERLVPSREGQAA